LAKQLKATIGRNGSGKSTPVEKGACAQLEIEILRIMIIAAGCLFYKNVKSLKPFRDHHGFEEVDPKRQSISVFSVSAFSFDLLISVFSFPNFNCE
jgi:hypothetical protein